MKRNILAMESTIAGLNETSSLLENALKETNKS